MDWTPFVVKDLVELILQLVALLTARGAIHSADSVVRLAPSAASCLVAPLPFWGDYARSHGTETGR